MVAKNRVTEVEQFDDIMSIVTEAPCAPPKLSIPFNSTDPLSPVEYFRAETVVISTNAATRRSSVYEMLIQVCCSHLPKVYFERTETSSSLVYYEKMLAWCQIVCIKVTSHDKKKDS